MTGMKRLAARRVLHEYRYDGASMTTKRASAPQNMSPNSFDVQRDRLQLMREAEDLERNFSPAKMLNRKYALYTAPISYHAQTGDSVLDAEVEEYLNSEIFPNCDITGRYDFFKMMEFGIMGCNRGGDYGWAFMRPGLEEGMSEEDALKLDLRIQAVEPDRIGGVYQNVVSNDYVSGLIIGQYGEVTHYRVFHRSMTTNVYDNPVDVPAYQFVHMTDPLRIDQYRGVSRLATATTNLRDLYEMIDFVKGKTKLASALTVFTNSNGATIGGGSMDPYATNIPNGQQAFQQDIAFGQINHLSGGTDIKFPSSNSPSSEEQALMTMLLKLTAMAYDLPFSFALDASALGGVSSRLESEQAKAEFERGQRVLAPHAHRIKNAFLVDAVAKGIFPMRVLNSITKGRWGYRSHPQPDIGREASAAVSMYEHGLLNPMKYWVDNGEDPETVAGDMSRWWQIKQNAAKSVGANAEDIFGAGPSKPLSISESMTESTTVDETTDTAFSRHNFGRHDSQIAQLTDAIRAGRSKREELKIKIADVQAKGPDFSPSLVERLRIQIDQIDAQIHRDKNQRAKLRGQNGQQEKKPLTPEQEKDNEGKAIIRDDRHALTEALKSQGYGEQEAYAIAYKIIESGTFNKSKLPPAIQAKYFPQ
jgi:capsid protein